MSHDTPQPNGTPSLPGFIEERTEGVAGPRAMLLRVWCRWCVRWHTHGYTGTKVGDTTDRAPHCYTPRQRVRDRLRHPGQRHSVRGGPQDDAKRYGRASEGDPGGPDHRGRAEAPRPARTRRVDIRPGPVAVPAISAQRS